MAAVVGVAVVLLAVVAVLLLRRRLVFTLHTSTFNASDIQINVVYKFTDSVITGHRLE